MVRSKIHILGYKHLYDPYLVYSLAFLHSGVWLCVAVCGCGCAPCDSAVSVAGPYAVCAGEQKLPFCRLLSGKPLC